MGNAVLSIDPGVNGGAVIWTREGTPEVRGWARKGRYNYEHLSHVVNLLLDCVKEFDVGTIAIERPHHSAVKGGAFQSLLYNDMKQFTDRSKGKVKFSFIAPASMKKLVTGNGRADKKEVQASVREFFDNRNETLPNMKTEHEYDAAGIGIAHFRRRRSEKRESA